MSFNENDLVISTRSFYLICTHRDATFGRIENCRRALILKTRSFYSAISIAFLLAVSVIAARAQTADEQDAAGRAFYAADKYAEAIDAFTKEIALDPSRWAAYYSRGLSRMYAKDRDGAIVDLTKTIELAPNYVGSYFWRCSLRRQKKDPDGIKTKIVKRAWECNFLKAPRLG